MSASATIRPVRPADFEAIAAILAPVVIHTAIHFAYTPPTAAELRAEWEPGRERFPYLVAEVAGEVVGFAKVGPFRARDAYAGTVESGVYIAERFWRQGLARALYLALIPAAREAGFKQLVAGIALPNPGSVALHEALGFVAIGVFPKVGYKFGQYHDVGFWQMELAAS